MQAVEALSPPGSPVWGWGWTPPALPCFGPAEHLLLCLTSGPPGKPSKMLHTLTLVSHYLEIEKIIQHDGKALSLKIHTTAVATV